MTSQPFGSPALREALALAMLPISCRSPDGDGPSDDETSRRAWASALAYADELLALARSRALNLDREPV